MYVYMRFLYIEMLEHTSYIQITLGELFERLSFFTCEMEVIPMLLNSCKT